MEIIEISRDQYERLKPLKFYWENLEKEGSLLNIVDSELTILAGIQKELIGGTLNKSCPECVRDMIRYLSLKYRKFEEKNYENISTGQKVESGKKRRTRLQHVRRG